MRMNLTAATEPWWIERGSEAQAPSALEILRDAAQWLVELGRPLWRVESFRLEVLEAAARAGELVIGSEAGGAASCMLLQTRDDFYWPDDPPGEALYLHKLAVRRSSAGRNWSGRLIQWAGTQAYAAGAQYLRLDTADRPELLSLYQRNGFYVVDQQPRSVEGVLVYRLQSSVISRA
jgi:GNAT superfamily N-acetyltransferase